MATTKVEPIWQSSCETYKVYGPDELGNMTTIGAGHSMVCQMARHILELRKERDDLTRRISEIAVNCPACGRHDFGLWNGPMERVAELEQELSRLRACVVLTADEAAGIVNTLNRAFTRVLNEEIRYGAKLDREAKEIDAALTLLSTPQPQVKEQPHD